MSCCGWLKDSFRTEVSAACGSNRQHAERYSFDCFDCFDCFESAAFIKMINKTGRKSIVFAGITTDLCAMQRALTARARGFNV